MSLVKKTTSSVDVYKVAGESIEIAFNNLKQSKKLNYHNLEVEDGVELSKDNISNGAIYKHSRALHRKYINNQISEMTVKGCLYNHKPILKDPTRLITHNIVSKGTKQWETVNSLRFDSGAEIEALVCTKEAAMSRAKELALEFNKTVHIVVSKRLLGGEGLIGIVEYVPYDNIDTTNTYVFWVYSTLIEEVEEEDIISENTEQDENGQLCIFEDLYSYKGREIINKL